MKFHRPTLPLVLVSLSMLAPSVSWAKEIPHRTYPVQGSGQNVDFEVSSRNRLTPEGEVSYGILFKDTTLDAEAAGSITFKGGEGVQFNGKGAVSLGTLLRNTALDALGAGSV